MKRSLFLVMFMLWAGSCPLLAQKLTASFSPAQVTANSNFQVIYSLSGGKPESFIRPEFTGFSLVGTQRVSGGGGTIIINGKVVQDGGGQEQWIYSLVAAKPGKYTIPAASVRVGGKLISSNPLTIDVKAGNPGGAADKSQQGTKPQTGSAKIFLRAVADKSTALIGEQITVTYKIYFQSPVTDLSFKNQPTFPGFWMVGLLNKDEKVKQYEETVDGEKFMVGELYKAALFPQKSGKLTLNPMTVECVVHIPVKSKFNNIFDQFFNDPFGNPFFQGQFGTGYQQERKVLKSGPLSIQVNPLPGTSPDDFCGFTGSLSMQAEVDRNELNVNDALNFRIKLSGTGNLSLVDQLKTNFPEGFEVYDPQISETRDVGGGVVGGTKTFSYLMIPRNPGTYAIKPVTLSYFDRSQNRYVTLSTPTFNVKVTGQAGGASGHGGQGSADIEVVGSDIKFIRTGDAGLSKTGSRFFGSVYFWILLFLPLLMFLVFVIVMRRRIRLRNDLALLRLQKANKLARRRLLNAELMKRAGNRDLFYEEISKALWGYISDRFTVPMSQLSLGSVAEILSGKGIDESTTGKYLELLNECEFARFAPSGQGGDMETIYRGAADIIVATEGWLKNGRHPA